MSKYFGTDGFRGEANETLTLSLIHILVVLLVGHDEIRQNMNKLEGKVILDTRHICNLKGIYRL